MTTTNKTLEPTPTARAIARHTAHAQAMIEKACDAEPANKHAVLDAMATYGGGFVKSLSHTMRLADPDNFRKLRAAFPEYWEQYEKMSGGGEDVSFWKSYPADRAVRIRVLMEGEWMKPLATGGGK